MNELIPEVFDEFISSQQRGKFMFLGNYTAAWLHSLRATLHYIILICYIYKPKTKNFFVFSLSK
jgi:hypothetical protein